LRLRPANTISCFITGDDLAVAVVRQGAELTRPNAAVLARVTISGFLQLDAAQRQAELAKVTKPAGESARILLTIPSAWCAMHPIAVTGAQWGGARAEVVRSIDRMLPLAPEHAEVGLVDLAGPNSGPGHPAVSGMLVGADRTRYDAWAAAIAEALGRPVTSVRCPVMAALGAGLQHEESAAVVEADGSAHLLRWGRLTAIDAPSAESRTSISFTNNEPEEVAVAAALADVAAPGSFQPITGPAPKPPQRWLAPAACAALAVALLIGAAMTSENRYATGIEAERQRQQALADDLAQTQRLRLETERLTRLLNEGIAASVADWRAMTPALIEAHDAIPADGVLHRFDLDRASVSLRGETRDAGAALGALEASPAFTQAAFTAPVTKTPDGADVFELRAERTSAGGTAP